MAEQSSGEAGSVESRLALLISSDAQQEPQAASQALISSSIAAATDVESPKPVPEQGGTCKNSGLDSPKPDAPSTDGPKTDARKPEAKSEQGSATSGKRRHAAMAAMVALVAMAGALGGALATAGFQHMVGQGAVAAGNRAIEASVARIDADILILKASLEHTSKMGMSQFNRTSDRLDRIEKAQVEPAIKLAKLSEAVDKLRAPPPVAPSPVAPAPVTAVAPVAAKDVTASIPAAVAEVPQSAPKTEVPRLPTVEGWVLRDATNGAALIQSRRGVFEVFAGEAIPGLGRVEAVRRQDGRWVVVTSKGLIVAR